MVVELNPVVVKAMSLLEAEGFEVYVVGGAIRDYYLGITCQDIDLTTNASLSQIEEVFKDYKIKRYKKGHTLGVVLNQSYLEISSFDGASLVEDLSNRDFSINAMAYHPSKGFIDLYHGQRDLKEKRLKTIKDPLEVLSKDPIRILRAIRFSGSLGFEIDAPLKGCILQNFELLKNVSKERCSKELNIILTSNQPSKLIREYLDVFSMIFPPLKKTYKFEQKTKWHHLDVLEHILTVLDSTKPNLVLRMAALFHDMEKPKCFTKDDKGIGHFYNHFAVSAETARTILKKMRYSEEFINRVYRLVYYHDRQIALNKRSVLRFLHDFGDKDLDLYFDLKRADIQGQNPDLLYRLAEVDQLEQYTKGILLEQNTFSVKHLNIKGNQLQTLGFQKEDIQNALEELLYLVMDGKIENTTMALIEYARKLKR